MRHIAKLRVQLRLGQIPYIDAVNRHAALRDVIKAGGQVQQSGLAAASGTDNGGGFTGVGGEADMLQRVLVRTGITEADIVEFHHAALAVRGQSLGGIGVTDGGGCGDDLMDAVGSDACAGQHDGDHRQHQEGHNDLHGVGDKGNHFAYLHSSQIHRLAAKPDDQQAGAVHNQGHKGHHGNHGAVGEQLGFHQIGVRFVKALFLKSLAAEGADGHNAGQDLAADKVQPVNKSLHQLKLGQCHAHQESNQQQQGSHCHKDDPFKTGVALGNVQDTADAQNGSVGDHTQQDNADKLYLLNVVGGAGNQRCCGEFFDFGVGIANHGAKHVAPQITTDGS